MQLRILFYTALLAILVVYGSCDDSLDESIEKLDQLDDVQLNQDRYNPLRVVIETVYDKLAGLRSYLSNLAFSVYYGQYVSRISFSFRGVRASFDRLSSRFADKKEIVIGDVRAFLKGLKGTSANVQDTLAPHIEKLIARLETPNQDPTEIDRVLNDILCTLLDLERTDSQLDEIARVSFVQKVGYYLIVAFNMVVRAAVRVFCVLAHNATWLTVVSVLVHSVALYISLKLGLAFVRVLVWMIKLPFRMIAAVLRFIFGSSEELEFDMVSKADLIKECDEPQPAHVVSAEPVLPSHPAELVSFELVSEEPMHVGPSGDETDKQEADVEGGPCALVESSSVVVAGSVAAFVCAAALI